MRQALALAPRSQPVVSPNPQHTVPAGAAFSVGHYVERRSLHGNSDTGAERISSSGLARANSLIVIPEDRSEMAAGSDVQVMFLY